MRPDEFAGLRGANIASPVVEERENYKDVLRHIAAGDGVGRFSGDEVCEMWMGWARAALAAWEDNLTNTSPGEADAR